MNARRRFQPVRTLALPGLLLLTLPLAAQPSPPAPVPPNYRPLRHAPAKPSAPPLNLSLIVLDPAHGGSDDGAHFASGAVEKDVTLAFAERLRPLLAARGFTVIVSRSQSSTAGANPDEPAASSIPSEDQRAEQANRLHPLACLLLHAANGGHGVHLFTSSLSPLTSADQAPEILSWTAAQAATVPQSLRLAANLSTSLNSVRVPLVLGRASVPPVDSLTCPAVAIELAPLAISPVTDPDYQERVADAIVTALVFWRDRLQTEAARAAEIAAQAAAPSPKPAIKTPASTKSKPAHAPAPVIRRPPESETTPPLATQSAPPSGGRP